MNTNQFQILCSPITLAGLTLKNRMFSAPTSLAELGPEEHYSRENIEYYKLKALGGTAVVEVGDVIVDLDTGRSHPQQVGINDPSAMPYLCTLADAIHSGGAAAAVEIDHGGALCSPEFIGGKCAIGPSGYIDPWGDEVLEMTESQIYEIADRYAEGAANAKAFGFDMVMLHGGHGWLIHQFISPVTNRRTDCWGGTLENRMRFPLLVIEKVRKAVGRAFPIEIRISGTEYVEGGYDLNEGIEIAKMLDGKVDLIHVSAGSQQEEYSAVLMHPGAFQRDMHNAYLAAEIKKHVKTPVLSVGAFNMPDAMENFLEKTGVDCIAMGRALIADPFLPRKILSGNQDNITPCIRCGECQSGMMRNRVLRCTVNPYVGRECDALHPLPTYKHKKVLIAGGGPAGMEAALLATERGHKVILCEATDRLGALRFTDNDCWFKKPMKRWRDSQVEKVLHCGADILLNTPVTKELVEEISPDALIIAIGGEPFAIPVPGADGNNVIFGANLKDDMELAENIAIIGGGMIGCEEAVNLANKGHNITIIEMMDELASECGRMHRLSLMHELEHERIQQALGMRCTRITKDGVYAMDKDGNECFFPCGDVIMAAGMKSKKIDIGSLRPLVEEIYVMGDARKASKIMNATREAYDAVTALGFM